MLKTILLSLLLCSPAFAGTLDEPVVGGTTAQPGAWPDAVAVLAADAMCTGTLIAPDVVLTAGHCIGTHPVEVVVGTVDISAPGGGGQVIAVKSAVAYPDWQHEYDVGLLILEHPASTSPRAVANACALKAGANVEVVGFGLTTKTGTGNNTKLHQAALAIDDATCTKDPACQPAIAPGGEFTAGGGGTDSCFGDSGGPVYVKTPHGSALIGVVSRGVGTQTAPCGGGGVYIRADAAQLVAWVERVTQRKLERAACDGPADGPGDEAAEAGGCSAGGGVLGGGVLIIIAALWILTRRRTTSA